MQEEKTSISFPFVNTHTHAAMVGFRGLAEDLPLKVWLEEYVWPMERERVTPEFIYEQTKKAICEMQKNNIRAFCDMYFFEEKVAQAAIELGMHVMLGEVILDYPTPSAKNAEEALMTTEALLKKYASHPLVTVAVAPHSVYALSKENLSKAKELADKYEAPVHIHCSETKGEVEDCLEKHGLTPVAYLDRLGLLNERCILAHCVWLSDDDIGLIAARKANVAHCPISNLKLGSGIAPIAKLLEKKVNVALGTDGAASSNRLDIWEAGKYAALLQKGITNDPANISLEDAYEMMSVNGMKALNLHSLYNMDDEKIKKAIAAMNNRAVLYEKNVEQIEFLT